MDQTGDFIVIKGAREHNLKDIDLKIPTGAITIITGVSGSGKSSLAFDTILAESRRRFFYTLSHFSRQVLDLGSRPLVQSISGLSPAIGLAQNDTQPSKRATVGTLTEINELLGLLFAKFSLATCPDHGLPTGAQTLLEIITRILSNYEGQILLICAVIAENKKGAFKNELARFQKSGFRAFIDGKIDDLNHLPKLDKNTPHTISVIIDCVKVKIEGKDRLKRGIEAALEHGRGFGQLFRTDRKGVPLDEKPTAFSRVSGCKICGFSWPRLDLRHFSANSLGRCEECGGLGFHDDPDFKAKDPTLRILDYHDLLCTTCKGTGINSRLKAITVGGYSIHDLETTAIEQILKFLQSLDLEGAKKNAAFLKIRNELILKMGQINDVGLGYLTLARRIKTLSGGELQRLKLALLLGEDLRDVIYILDEPSQGLHPYEIEKLFITIARLKKLGNTIILVDHDETLMRLSDWIIDLGPGGGIHGGRLMAKFRPQEAPQYAKVSLTAAHLGNPVGTISQRSQNPSSFIEIHKPRLHNLRMDNVRIPHEALSVVSGVSGAGKSTLILSLLYDNVRNYLDCRDPEVFRFCHSIKGLDTLKSCLLIDRHPIAKISTSMPITYLDIFTDIRNLYASLKDAQIMGLTPRSFSLFAAGARCEECKGTGLITLSMKFLEDAKINCPVCMGLKYQSFIKSIKYQGLSIADVLSLTVEEANEHFKNFPRITKKLQPACDIGLSYLKLGQLSSTLSGGEAQRLKLVPLLGKGYNKDSLIIIDEPSTGLHFSDVAKLLTILDGLVAKGATVVVLEHNFDIILRSDWLIDIGPEGAQNGGELVFEGKPLDIVRAKSSHTGRQLAKSIGHSRVKN